MPTCQVPSRIGGNDRIELVVVIPSFVEVVAIGPSTVRGLKVKGVATGNHAIVFGDGYATDLNSLIAPSSGWLLSEAWSINDSGQIVGQGYVSIDN